MSTTTIAPRAYRGPSVLSYITALGGLLALLSVVSNVTYGEMFLDQATGVSGDNGTGALAGTGLPELHTPVTIMLNSGADTAICWAAIGLLLIASLLAVMARSMSHLAAIIIATTLLATTMQIELSYQLEIGLPIVAVIAFVGWLVVFFFYGRLARLEQVILSLRITRETSSPRLGSVSTLDGRRTGTDDTDSASRG